MRVVQTANLKVHAFSALERKRFEKATAGIMKEFEEILGAHIVSKTEENFYKKNNKENIVVIGVEADLSMGAKGAGLAIKRGVESPSTR